MAFLKKTRTIFLLFLFILCFSVKAQAGCSPSREGRATVIETYNTVCLDVSDLSYGFISISYSGDNSKVRVIISKEKDSKDYIYALDKRSEYEVYPLTEGSGEYRITVNENTSGDYYRRIFDKTITVNIEDEFTPFLYASQLVNYSLDDEMVAFTNNLVEGAANNTEIINRVYDYITSNITYDYEKIETDLDACYVPDNQKTLEDKKAICVDYASLMASMLRSQNIPTKMVYGDTPFGYHAWCLVWTGVETGWQRYDATFYAGGKGCKEIQDFISNDANYKISLVY